MPVRKLLLTIGASMLAMSCATTEVAEAKKKPSVPKSISPQEKQQGAKLHPEILKEFGGNYESPQTDYVVRVGKNIAVQSGLGNAQSDFTVSFLNSPVNNAFAIPGGYIYITRQLTALCNSEAEMAGVLGHEVGHVAARHSKNANAGRHWPVFWARWALLAVHCWAIAAVWLALWAVLQRNIQALWHKC